MYKELPIFVKTTLPYGKGYFKYFKILFIAFFLTTFPFSLRILLPKKSFMCPFQVVLMGHDMIVFTEKQFITL